MQTTSGMSRAARRGHAYWFEDGLSELAFGTVDTALERERKLLGHPRSAERGALVHLLRGLLEPFDESPPAGA